MKFECSVCGIVGTLQQRGNSYRVQHYVGYENGKRVYLYHKVEGMEVNGSKSMEVKKACNGIFLGKEAPPKGCIPHGEHLTRSLPLN
jgi:hypothetical protein